MREDNTTGELFKPHHHCQITKEEVPIYSSANNVLSTVAPVQAHFKLCSQGINYPFSVFFCYHGMAIRATQT